MRTRIKYILVFTPLLLLWTIQTALAHHVLGRPSYALNEDSNTPPAMQVETLIGDFDVNYMVYPAFPKPGEPGRVHLYVKDIKTSKSFEGKVIFTVRDNSWKSKLGFGSHNEKLGTQVIDDFVYRQGFLFSQPGDYIISARFEANNEPYIIDFPLRIGPPPSWQPIGIAVAIMLVLLVGVSLLQRRRSMTEKIRSQHNENG